MLGVSREASPPAPGISSSVSEVLSNAERLINAIDNPEISRRFREHSRHLSSSRMKENSLNESKPRRSLLSCSPVPCLDASKASCTPSALGRDFSLCRDLSVLSGAGDHFAGNTEQQQHRALREMTNTSNDASLYTRHRGEHASQHRGGPDVSISSVLREGSLSRGGPVVRSKKEIVALTPSAGGTPRFRETLGGGEQGAGGQGMSAAEVQGVCRLMERMCHEMLPSFDFRRNNAENGVHATEGVDAVTQRLQVVGMTASARVETTLLIRTRLKEQLAEAERHAEDAGRDLRRDAERDLRHVVSEWSREQASLRADAAAAADHARRCGEAAAREAQRCEEAEALAEAFSGRLAQAEREVQGARAEAAQVCETLQQEREMRANVAGDLLAAKARVNLLEADLRETKLLQKFLGAGGARRGEADAGEDGREGGGARSRQLAVLRQERTALLERCEALLAQNKQLSHDKVVLEGEKAQGARRVGEALAKHAVSHRELSLLSQNKIGDDELAVKLLHRNLSAHASNLSQISENKSNLSHLSHQTSLAHAHDATGTTLFASQRGGDARGGDTSAAASPHAAPHEAPPTSTTFASHRGDASSACPHAPGARRQEGGGRENGGGWREGAYPHAAARAHDAPDAASLPHPDSTSASFASHRDAAAAYPHAHEAPAASAGGWRHDDASPPLPLRDPPPAYPGGDPTSAYPHDATTRRGYGYEASYDGGGAARDAGGGGLADNGGHAAESSPVPEALVDARSDGRDGVLFRAAWGGGARGGSEGRTEGGDEASRAVEDRPAAAGHAADARGHASGPAVRSSDARTDTRYAALLRAAGEGDARGGDASRTVPHGAEGGGEPSRARGGNTAPAYPNDATQRRDAAGERGGGGACLSRTAAGAAGAGASDGARLLAHLRAGARERPPPPPPGAALPPAAPLPAARGGGACGAVHHAPAAGADTPMLSDQSSFRGGGANQITPAGGEGGEGEEGGDFEAKLMRMFGRLRE
ncbi:hypothetical protein T484DRAFT_1895329 [Baffinella frigidus]|nr:hypothetical protein T484DRAFT_1895329 [Cryptophyta sp. CCMP2293]